MGGIHYQAVFERLQPQKHSARTLSLQAAMVPKRFRLPSHEAVQPSAEHGTTPQPSGFVGCVTTSLSPEESRIGRARNHFLLELPQVGITALVVDWRALGALTC
jgi:hypothetical protein